VAMIAIDRLSKRYGAAGEFAVKEMSL